MGQSPAFGTWVLYGAMIILFMFPISYGVMTSLPKEVFNNLQELQHGKLGCTPE